MLYVASWEEVANLILKSRRECENEMVSQIYIKDGQVHVETEVINDKDTKHDNA